MTVINTEIQIGFEKNQIIVWSTYLNMLSINFITFTFTFFYFRTRFFFVLRDADKKIIFSLERYLVVWSALS